MSDQSDWKPMRIPTKWGDFWAIGHRSAAIFLTEDEAAQAIAKLIAAGERRGLKASEFESVRQAKRATDKKLAFFRSMVEKTKE